MTQSGLDASRFDTIIDGQQVKLYVLTNNSGMEVCVTNYGGRVVSLMVPDRDGKLTDVVLGFDNIAQYADTLNSPSDYGASVGRYANRIGKAQITIDGMDYALKANDHGNCLHGGFNSGWQNKVYSAEQIGDSVLRLTIVAEDGENGFPGRVEAVTTYTLTADNTLDVMWTATTDKPTVITQTQHNYYNLSGDFTQAAYDQMLHVNADEFVVTDSESIPTGELRSVVGTPFDFRTPRAVGDSIHSNYEQARNVGGIDHCFCLNTQGDDTQVCASLYSPRTGIYMEVFTNEPGIQIYSANFQGVGRDATIVRKHGLTYPQHVSVCMETHRYPDAPHHPEWESAMLRPGEQYYSHAAYRFSVKR